MMYKGTEIGGGFFVDITACAEDGGCGKMRPRKTAQERRKLFRKEEFAMQAFVADLHTHSIMSGHAFGTVRELAAVAAERGMKLLGVTEHGPGIPGTCDPIYFRNFVDAPRKLYGVEMLYGSEVNVLNTGEVDLDARHLACLDYAVAGIHGLCYENVGMVKNTDNVLRCMENRKVRFISHPDTDAYPMDYDALTLGAKELGVALEVNNSSLRKWSQRPGCVENYRKMLPLCAERGVNIVVNTDAHDPDAVGDFTLARKLLVELDFPETLILNRDVETVKAFLLR